MFKTTQFLDLYLPDYFNKVYQTFLATKRPQSTRNWSFPFVAQFIKFSEKIYTQLNEQKSFLDFLHNHFQCLGPLSLQRNPKQCLRNSKNINRIMEKIEQNTNKFQLSCVKLFLKILKVKLHSERQQNLLVHQNDSVVHSSQYLLKALNQTRLQYQNIRFQIRQLKDYDQYIQEIFQFSMKGIIQHKMKQIIQLVLANQCSNIDEKTVQAIQQMLCTRQQKQIKQRQSQFQEPQTKIQQKSIIRKTKKIDKNKLSPLNKKSIYHHHISPTKMLRSPRIRKNSQQITQSKLRIQNYAHLKKERQLNKNRTIYCQRKNMHAPKLKDILDKMSCFASQSTFSTVCDSKSTDKRFRKFENSQSTQDDYQNDCLLVRSTPKQSKKLASNIKIISHRLDFC